MYGRPKIDYQSLDSENKARVLLSDFRTSKGTIELAKYRLESIKKASSYFQHSLLDLTPDEYNKHTQNELWYFERKLDYGLWLETYVETALEFIKSTMPDHYNVLKLVYIDREGFRDEPVKALLSQLGMTPKIYRRIRNEAMQTFLTLCPVDAMPYVDQVEAHGTKLKPGSNRSYKGI